MINVGGFLFEDEATAAQAKKEEDGIRFIKEKTPLNNPQMVLKLYQTLLQQNLFETPVGFRFLAELRDFIVNSNIIDNDELPPLDTSAFVKKVVVEKEVTIEKEVPVPKASKKEKKSGNYKTAFHVTLFFAIIFGLSVLGMFAIAELSSNNVNILNYREKIIDEYEQWEVELKEKEDQLRDWEKELSEREDALKSTQSQ